MSADIHSTPQLFTPEMLMHALGMSKPNFYDALKDGRIPPGIQIGPRTRRWKTDVINQIEALANERAANRKNES